MPLPFRGSHRRDAASRTPASGASASGASASGTPASRAAGGAAAGEAATGPGTRGSGLTTPVLLLMAVATGLSAGGNYFNQPLLDSIASALGTSHTAAAATVTVAQVTYAVGLLLLVPLGDMLERRALSVGLILAAAAGQALSGLAPGIGVLLVGTAVAGLFSVAAQVLVPLAADLAAPGRGGRAVGTVMSGLLLGILLARTVAGLLAGLGGWSTVYRCSAVAMALVALALWRVLPPSRPSGPTGYAATLRSSAHLVRTLPRLRTRAALGGLSFASVSALFATMSFLLSAEPFRFDDTRIGLVGLAGVAGALMANAAGRLADRGRAQTATGACVAVLLLSWGALALGGDRLGWFLTGMVLGDLALQGVHVSNQNIVYALAPHARARLTSVYMTTYFAGAAAGSALGSAAWSAAGWGGVCVLGAVLAAAAAAVWYLDLAAARADTARRAAGGTAV